MSFQKSRAWNARWIWAPGSGKEKNVYYYFRKTFKSEEEGTCRIFITADTRYQLFINGEFIGRGAPQSQPYFQYYDTHDISDCVKRGVNTIAVIVNHIGNLPDTRGGLLAEVTDGDGRVYVSTDGSWSVSRARAWKDDTYMEKCNKMTPYQEFFDARKVPDQWMSAEYDESGWEQASVVAGRISDRPPAGGIWSKLVPRDIPYMDTYLVYPAAVENVEESIDIMNRTYPYDLSPGLSMAGTPVTYARAEDTDNLCSEKKETVFQCSVNHRDLDFDGIYAPAVVLDFGRVLTARIRISLKGTAGGYMDIGYAERLIDGHFNNALECRFADRYIMKDGEQVFESFAWKGFRYVKIRFRYCFEPVTVMSVYGAVSAYPYEERGAFTSSDDTLNDVFRISRETLRLCSNECLMDTPWREQAQWLGDIAMATAPAVYACFGDTKLTGKFFRQAANNQHPTGMISVISNTVHHGWSGVIPDYSLWWVQGLWSHYMYTGEPEWIHRFYSQALRVWYAHIDYIDDHGLIKDMPYWPFIDWADIDKRGECTAYNAIFYGTARTVRRMARFKGDRYTEQQAGEIISAIEEHFEDRLFDQDRRCFADANIDGVLSEKASEHASMAAVNWDLCSEETARTVIETLYEGDTMPVTEAQPFFTAVVLRALHRAGRFDIALDIIRNRWGRRMVDTGATSVYEEWYQNGSWRDGSFKGFLRTHSHAWSACPAEFLISHLIGLDIEEPGCSRISLRPQKTAFDYTAVFPAPQGSISVSCTDGTLDISCPDAVSADIKEA